MSEHALDFVRCQDHRQPRRLPGLLELAKVTEIPLEHCPVHKYDRIERLVLRRVARANPNSSAFNQPTVKKPRVAGAGALREAPVGTSSEVVLLDLAGFKVPQGTLARPTSMDI